MDELNNDASNASTVSIRNQVWPTAFHANVVRPSLPHGNRITAIAQKQFYCATRESMLVIMLTVGQTMFLSTKGSRGVRAYAHPLSLVLSPLAKSALRHLKLLQSFTRDLRRATEASWRTPEACFRHMTALRTKGPRLSW